MIPRRLSANPPVFRANCKSLFSTLIAYSVVLSLTVQLPPTLDATPKDKKPKQGTALKGLPITELTPDEAILHALNRLAYGPRPGDLERVRQMGLAKWIDQQLNPNSLDDKAVEARLANFPTLKMSSAKLLAEYPQLKKQDKQAFKQARAEQLRSEQEQMKSSDSVQGSAGQPGNADNGTAASAEPENMPPSQQAAEDTDAPSPMKQASADDARNIATRGAGKRDVLGGDPNSVPRAIADDSRRPQRIIQELAMAKVTRAIYSERQLQQVLDDFWFNHFNVFANKGADRWLITSYERDVIQPHTLGKFKDLLTATAKSPAMLFYLDNFLSVDPNAAARLQAERAMRQSRRGPFGRRSPSRAPPQQQARKNVRGLNENYGRELMELHTLGVDGGYTQKDVTEVARCFTGWTIERPRADADFRFDERLHDPGPKLVLGKKIHAGGMKDGEEVIELLARHPSTAKFISTKLARRFVSDDPPASLVNRMAQSFQSSDGDIRAVLRTMIYAPEFWSRQAYRAKIKTPFELVVSTARALGTDVDTPMPLVQWTARIGQPLYLCQPPTGYSEKGQTWIGAGALLNRLNYSLALAGNRVRGSRTDLASLMGTDSANDAKDALPDADSAGAAKQALARAIQVFLNGQAAPSTAETLEKQLESPQVLQARLDDPVKQVDLGVVAGLVLGAPEFQRR
jgi:uncharacterized protein (DUF1800 family)